jgi:c-di-GMP-binding flagellar brake protein YcgR
MGDEQRRDPRVGTRLTTFLKDLKTGKVRRALTRDISAGGLCVVTDELFEIGTMLGVEVQLPDRERPIVCQAVVVRSQFAEGSSERRAATIETGLQFVAIDPKERSLLQYYAKLNPPPPVP